MAMEAVLADYLWTGTEEYAPRTHDPLSSTVLILLI